MAKAEPQELFGCYAGAIALIKAAHPILVYVYIVKELRYPPSSFVLARVFLRSLLRLEIQ